jgi:hypothetical protein
MDTLKLLFLMAPSKTTVSNTTSERESNMSHITSAASKLRILFYGVFLNELF